jgi:sugar lactone lactonase YvrE
VDNAYTTPPAYYLNPNLSVDLTGAVDMAIDGNLYVLFADGKVLKFFDGDLRPFSMAGLPSRMKNPTSIFVSGKQEPDAPGAVYVADAGNERILQFDKSGNFVRQFRDTTTGNHLQNMRGIYVDDERGRLFVLSGRTLWQTNLPGFE